MFKSEPFKFDRKGYEYVSTWDANTTNAVDIQNYAERGYKGNSLIFACIREKATSYAGMRFVLVPGDEDLPYIERHNVLELLENPSSDMDGTEFRAAVRTSLDCSGNCYIHKIRTPTPEFPERTRWPVTELEMIRADYVKILPGRTRDADVYEVSVDGKIIARIPAADMIHLKEFDPSNDFYGVSKIQVIMREGDLDQRMTDFERSFFMNAGVPMGILTTRTKVSQDEKNQIKSAFRRGLNGIGKWFDLLVINADEGKYQQLGIPQNEMEASATRELVESRICAVLGVPSVLVGALVGLKNAADRANYQTGLYQFWTETMLPEANLIASALTRELMPEFRTPNERGYRIGHDISRIAALQKDNSNKMQAVAMLIREVGQVIPVNEILKLADLPLIDSGDQVMPAPAKVPSVLQPFGNRSYLPSERKALETRPFHERQIDERMQLIADAEPELAAALEEQARRLEADARPDDPDWIGSKEEAIIAATLAPFVIRAVRSGYVIALQELGLDSTTDDEIFSRLIAEASEHIKGITEHTRTLVAEHLALGRERNYSIEQIVRGVLDDEYPALAQLGAFSRARAEAIVRTELSYAQNRATAAAWRASGLVERVIIYDGIDWDAPCVAANGQTWTLDEFDANPYEHPRCIRSATPVRIEERQKKKVQTFIRDESGRALSVVEEYV